MHLPTILRRHKSKGTKKKISLYHVHTQVVHFCYLAKPPLNNRKHFFQHLQFTYSFIHHQFSKPSYIHYWVNGNETVDFIYSHFSTWSGLTRLIKMTDIDNERMKIENFVTEKRVLQNYKNFNRSVELISKLCFQVFLFIYLGKSRKDNETMSQVDFEKKIRHDQVILKFPTTYTCCETPKMNQCHSVSSVYCILCMHCWN